MIERPADLPDYDLPPIDEVVLGVEFAQFQNFTQAHLGILWNLIRDDYPRTEDQPPIIDPAVFQTIPFQFPPSGLQPGLPSFRTWFISQDDQYILQIQNDRLVYNWRRRSSPYPRIEPLAKTFIEHLRRFQSVLLELGFGPIAPKQIEVSYINWITDMEMSAFFLPAVVPNTHSPEVSDHPTQQQWAARYAVTIENRPEGSLNVTCGSAIRPPNNEKGQQLMLSLKQPTASVDDAEDIIGAGRNIIVQTFTDLTTEEGQQRWKIKG